MGSGSYNSSILTQVIYWIGAALWLSYLGRSLWTGSIKWMGSAPTMRKQRPLAYWASLAAYACAGAYVFTKVLLPSSVATLNAFMHSP